MKKLAYLLVIGLALISTTGQWAQGALAPDSDGQVVEQVNALYVYTPNPADLWDLDHYKYYICRIDDFTVASGETISSASITINDINNWQYEENHLYIHLLSGDDFTTIPFNVNGIYTGSDNQGGGDNLNAYDGILLDEYVDNDGGSGGDVVNYTYSFSGDELAALAGYAADGVWGIAFDPDCHYWNTGIQLTIGTSNVPEPFTLSLLTLGGVLLLRRKKRA